MTITNEISITISDEALENIQTGLNMVKKLISLKPQTLPKMGGKQYFLLNFCLKSAGIFTPES